MAWNVVTNIDNTVRSNGVSSPERYWNDTYDCYYLRGVFLMHFVGTLYVDSNDRSKYKVVVDVNVQHEYERVGGYWDNNEGNGITLYFGGKEFHNQSVGRAISCWSNSPHTDVLVTSINKEFTVTAPGTLEIYVNVWQSGGARIGSPNNVPSSLKPFTSVQGFSGSYFNFIDYEINPYSEPTSYYTSTTPVIGKVSETEFKTTHNITLGKGGELQWVKVLAFPYNTSWNYGKYSSISSSVKNTLIKSWNATKSTSATLTHKLSTGDGFTDGNRYKIATYFSDDHFEWISGDDKVVYTYRKPTMSNVSMTSALFSPQDNAQIKWTTNSRTWTGHENDFTTKLSYGNKSIDLTNAPTNATNGSTQSASSSKTFDNSTITKLFSADDRSVSKLSKSITITRTSPSSGYTASASVTANIQYQPTKTPNNTHVLDGSGTNVKSKNIIIQDTPTIDVDWSYPISSGAAGIVNGYYLKVYSDANCTKAVNDKEYTIAVSTNGGAGSKSLNTASELQRGVMNYAKVTPYYTKPNGSGTIRGTNPVIIPLVLPISRLGTPTIDYPINNSTWHNKNFRILFTLPTDDDFSVVGKTESNYRYQNIEIKITPSGSSALTYTFSSNSNIFSTNTLSYKKKIAINPSILTSFPNANSYKVEIRVQRNYFVTSGDLSWSKWSSAITVKNTAISNQSFVAGMEIKASHYKYVRDASIRLYNTYPIKALPSANVAQSAGDTINHSEYKGIYDTILAIQSGVNGYCTYDSGRENVKFNQTINDLTSKPPKQEFITALKEDNSIGGRNYKNILVDDMNLLY